MADKKTIAPVRNIVFIDGVVHRIEKRLPADDLLVTTNLKDHRRVAYSYMATKHKLKKAWSTRAVGNMMNRSLPTIRSIIANGHIEVSGKVFRKDFKAIVERYWWSAEDVLNLHEYFRVVKGTAIPTKDGLWQKAHKIPARAEVARMLDSGVVSYVRTKDGEFIPAFLAPD